MKSEGKWKRAGAGIVAALLLVLLLLVFGVFGGGVEEPLGRRMKPGEGRASPELTGRKGRTKEEGVRRKRLAGPGKKESSQRAETLLVVSSVDGKPVPGAEVKFLRRRSFSKDESYFIQRFEHCLYTDSRGKVDVPPDGRGKFHWVRIRAKGFALQLFPYPLPSHTARLVRTGSVDLYIQDDDPSLDPFPLHLETIPWDSARGRWASMVAVGKGDGSYLLDRMRERMIDSAHLVLEGFLRGVKYRFSVSSILAGEASKEILPPNRAVFLLHVFPHGMVHFSPPPKSEGIVFTEDIEKEAASGAMAHVKPGQEWVPVRIRPGKKLRIWARGLDWICSPKILSWPVRWGREKWIELNPVADHPVIVLLKGVGASNLWRIAGRFQLFRLSSDGVPFPPGPGPETKGEKAQLPGLGSCQIIGNRIVLWGIGDLPGEYIVYDQRNHGAYPLFVRKQGEAFSIPARDLPVYFLKIGPELARKARVMAGARSGSENEACWLTLFQRLVFPNGKKAWFRLRSISVWVNRPFEGQWLALASSWRMRIDPSREYKIEARITSQGGNGDSLFVRKLREEDFVRE